MTFFTLQPRNFHSKRWVAGRCSLSTWGFKKNKGIFWVPKICWQIKDGCHLGTTRFTPRKIKGWNLPITHLERTMIFQISTVDMFNLQGCKVMLFFGAPNMFALMLWDDGVKGIAIPGNIPLCSTMLAGHHLWRRNIHLVKTSSIAFTHT